MEEEIKKIVMEDLKALKKEPKINEYFSAFMLWRNDHIKDYEETKESLKYVFQAKGLAMPKNWEELFVKWSKNKPEIYEIMCASPRDRKIWEIPLIPKEYFIEWAHIETNRVLGSKAKKERKELKVRKSLKEHFFNKYSDHEIYNSIKHQLFAKGLLSEDKSTWVGTAMNGKIQLVGAIKFLGKKHLVKTLSAEEIEFIAKVDFCIDVSLGSIKKGKAEFGEVYFE